MNEFLFIITLLVNFIGIIISYKLFKKTGLFIWIAFATILANIEVAKCVDIFGMSLTLGNVIYGTIFLATDILNENYGEKEAKKGVLIGFFSLIVFTLLEQINLLYIPNENDFVNEAMQTIFGIMPRICFSSIIIYLISNIIDTKLYNVIKNKFPKKLWLRNNGSTLISQLIDSVLFTFFAFFGIYNIQTIIEIIITTYLLKVIISLCDTPFIYLGKKIGDD